MSEKEFQVHNLIDLDVVFENFPRKRWQHKSLLLVSGETCRDIQNASAFRVTIQETESDIVVEEVPVMRLPAGIEKALLFDKSGGHGASPIPLSERKG